MTFIKTFGLLIITTNLVPGQSINRQINYYQKVIDFYNFLDKEEASIWDAYNFFSNYTYEVEEHLFFNRCVLNKTESECICMFEKRILNPRISSSLLFEVLRENKEIFFQVEKDSINEIINNSSLVNDSNPSSITLKLIFPNGKIICFSLNKYCDEPIYIQNIILWSGESIFNLLGIPE